MFGKAKSFITLAIVFFVLTSIIIGFAAAASAPWSDSKTAERIAEVGKNENQAMKHLDYLCNKIGMRPAGSKAHHETAEWAYEQFREFGLSNVHLEQCDDWPGYPDAEWATGMLDKLTSVERTGGADSAGRARVPVFNVVADIPGAEISDEYVIVGAHYDCVPIGAGALDNGTGVTAVMEAARILVKAGAAPRRTIRFILFAGEESGLLGSRGYVRAHPELMPKISAMYNMDHGTNFISGVSVTGPLAQDMAAIFAPALTLDRERPFKITEVDWLLKGDPNCCQGGQMAQVGEGGPMVVMKAYKRMPDGSLQEVEGDPAESAKLEQGGAQACGDSTARRIVVSGGCPPGCGGAKQTSIEDLKKMGVLSDTDLARLLSDDSAGVKQIKAITFGTSDQTIFLNQGVPGFWLAQDGDTTVAYPAHTAGDTYDKVIPEYLEHNATVIALGALGTANLDHLLSRERLTQPESQERPGIER